MFHDAGPGGRSVLGMVAVQVERDPKTGATVVRSVAPVSPGVTAPGVTAPGVTAPGVTAVFDDGRKSIHAVGGAGKTPPSSEELGQILSIVDGVGMKVLLDDVAGTTPKKPKTENADAAGTPREHVVTFSTHHATPKVDDGKDDGEKHGDGEERGEDDGEDEERGEERGEDDGEDEDEERGVTSVRDVSGDVGNVDELRLDEGPVTLVFLGYSDAADGGEDEDGVITVERVIISEDGEETLVAAAPRGGREFQEVPLDGNGVQKEEDEEDEEDEASSSRRTDGDDTKSKRKSCRCCSVM